VACHFDFEVMLCRLCSSSDSSKRFLQAMWQVTLANLLYTRTKESRPI